MNKTLSMVLLSISLFAAGCSEVVADDSAEPDTATVTSALTAEEQDIFCRKAGEHPMDALGGDSADVRKASEGQTDVRKAGEGQTDVRKAGKEQQEY